jgi:hypothetical protein
MDIFGGSLICLVGAILLIALVFLANAIHWPERTWFGTAYSRD